MVVDFFCYQLQIFTQHRLRRTLVLHNSIRLFSLLKKSSCLCVFVAKKLFM